MIHKTTLTAYSIAHCAVDFSCAFLVYRTMLDTPELGLCLLLYNFFAFAGQMPLGLLADGWNRNGLLAAAGCAAVALACIPVWPAAPAAVIAGVGNGMFHVGGGLDVLNDSGEKASALGIFVSPGALGLYLGGVLGRGSGGGLWLPAALLLASAALILWAVPRTYGGFVSLNVPPELSLSRREGLQAVCLTAVVVLRSYMGFNQTLPWKDEGGWGVILTLALVLGKAAGGFAGDRLGMKKAALFSLGAAAVCYLFASHPAVGTAAVFLFNMTMPITLWGAARLMPGSKGFAFGLLTFGLFLGFLPTWLGLPSLLTEGWAMALAAAGSGVILLAGLKGERAVC